MPLSRIILVACLKVLGVLFVLVGALLAALIALRVVRDGVPPDMSLAGAAAAFAVAGLIGGRIARRFGP